MSNPLRQLAEVGQSFWLDNLSRDLINSGELKRLIDEDGLRGITSNPTIFEKAFSSGDTYDDEIARLASEGASVEEIAFEGVPSPLALEDVSRAPLPLDAVDAMTFHVRRSTFHVPRSMFNVQRSMFNVRRSSAPLPSSSRRSASYASHRTCVACAAPKNSSSRSPSRSQHRSTK
jgi:hypothetical protein